MKKKVILSILSILALSACTGTEISYTSSSSDSSNQSLNTSTNDSSESSKPVSSSSEDTTLKELLTKLKSDVQFDGTYTMDAGEEGKYMHEVTSIFTSNAYLSRDVYYEQSLPEVKYWSYNDIVSYEDEKVYLVLHNADNTVTKIEAKDNQQNPYSWEEFQNPFLSVDEKDFTLVSENKYQLKSEVGLEVGIAISGWNHTSCTSFNLEVKDTTIALTFVLGGVDGDVTYTFEASNFGTATVDVGPFAHVDASHNKLKTALESVGENYTLHMEDKALSEDSEDISYNLYKTDTEYYNDYDDYGYVKVDDVVNEFEITEGAVTKYEVADEDNPFVNLLDLDSIAPEIFDETETNVFTLKDHTLAGAVVSAFSNNADDKLIGEWLTIDATITLNDDGKIDKLEYYYDAYGMVSKRTVTFENVGTTTLPSEVSTALENHNQGGEEEECKWTKFIGTYEGTLSTGTFDGSSTVTIVITENTITVNEKEATGITFDESYEEFKFTIDETEYNISDASYDNPVTKIVFMSSDYSAMGYGIERKA